ncbi:hypothetical protein [Streptomyces gilvifuscus]|uniref:DUF2530 domain-containing protein n=1 Tax=Streptomyces gilvifuscus TaxID=1550617 RepID=A0ABT5G957_9ACTN|nr:hypothetical protein [Streptomyces gilvifuscus]MDC2961294.1 hypothetical protein [Streptomyces gilvifuscus]
MSGGLPLLRNRHVAAVFIVVVYALVGALSVTVVSRGSAWGWAAAVAGGFFGAAFGVWRIRRTPEGERADEGNAW